MQIEVSGRSTQYTLHLHWTFSSLFISTVQAYLETQSKLIAIYHKANEIWSEYCATKFAQKLSQLLDNEMWNDLNASAVLWQGK